MTITPPPAASPAGFRHRVRAAAASPFSKGVLAIATGTAVFQAIALAASPVLTRLYQPSDFGFLQAYASLVIMGVVIAAARFDLAIQLPVPDRESARLLVCSLVMSTLVSAVLLVVALSAGQALARLLGAPQLGPYLFYVPLGIFGASWYQALTAWGTRRRDFKRVAKTRVAQGAALVAGQIGLGLASFAAPGLLFSDVVSRSVGVSSLLRMVRQRDWVLFENLGFHRILATFRKHWRFSAMSTTSGLMNSAGLAVPPLLFLSLYGPVVAGLIALSSRVIAAPMTLIGQSVAQVYVGEAGHRVRTSPASFSRLFRTTAVVLMALGVVPSLVLLISGPALFELVFGAAWREAGEYARLLSFMFVFQLTASALSQTLTLLNKPRHQLVWDASRLALVLGTILVVHGAGGSARQAVLGYGISMSLAYSLLLYISFHAAHRNDL